MSHTVIISCTVLNGSHRTLLHDAVSKLRQVGIEPTDVSNRNALWDGERLTLIDFVDPLCS